MTASGTCRPVVSLNAAQPHLAEFGRQRRSHDSRKLRMTAPLRRQLTLGAATLSVLTSFFWGGTAVSNRFAVDSIPPLAVGGIRFALAVPFLLVWCWIAKSPVLPKRDQWAPCLIAGTLLFVQIATIQHRSRLVVRIACVAVHQLVCILGRPRSNTS